MTIPTLNIILDNDTSIYHPGQTLSGRIEFTVIENPERARGIGVIIKGECETSWNESVTRTVDGSKETIIVPRAGKEDYFNNAFFVVGSEHGDSVEIPVGTNVYPITCEIPSNIPHSFEGEHGFVRYSIISTVYRPWQATEIVQSMLFTVVTPLDLNLSLVHTEPIVMVIEKTLRCCCWAPGDVSVDLRLPVSGYCSGQAIPLKIICENNSTRSVLDINVVFRKNVTFKFSTPTISEKKDEFSIAELSLGSVRRHQSLSWQRHLQVPPLPSSYLNHCGMIDIEYEIELLCVYGGCHFDKKISRPVFIGTVPLTGYEFRPQVSLNASQTNVTVNQMYYGSISKSIQSSTSGPPKPTSEISTIKSSMIAVALLGDGMNRSSFDYQNLNESPALSCASLVQPEDQVTDRLVNEPTDNINMTDPKILDPEDSDPDENIQ